MCLQLRPKNLFQQCFEWLIDWNRANLQYYIRLIDYTACSYYNITDHISHTVHYIPVTYSFYNYKINGSCSSLISFSFFSQLKIPITQEPPFFFLNQWVCFYLDIFFVLFFWFHRWWKHTLWSLSDSFNLV